MYLANDHKINNIDYQPRGKVEKPGLQGKDRNICD